MLILTPYPWCSEFSEVEAPECETGPCPKIDHEAGKSDRGGLVEFEKGDGSEGWAASWLVIKHEGPLLRAAFFISSRS